MMNKNLRIENLQWMNVEKKRLEPMQILVRNGVIVDHGSSIAKHKDHAVLDAKGALCMPGLNDYSARILSHRSLCDFNQDLKNNGFYYSAVSVDYLWYEKNKYWFHNQCMHHKYVVPFLPMVKAKKMAPMLSMKQEGACGFWNAGMRHIDLSSAINIFRYLRGVRLPVLIDLTEHYQNTQGLHSGDKTYWMGQTGCVNIEESIWAAYYIELVYLTGLPIHFKHITSQRTLSLIQQAKRSGLPVSCDVSILHLLFSYEDIRLFDDQLKINPPLRLQDDQAAFWEAIKTGEIETISTLHATSSLNSSFFLQKKYWNNLSNFWCALVTQSQRFDVDIFTLIKCVNQPPKTFEIYPEFKKYTLKKGAPSNFVIWRNNVDLPNPSSCELTPLLGLKTNLCAQLEYVVMGEEVICYVV